MICEIKVRSQLLLGILEKICIHSAKGRFVQCWGGVEERIDVFWSRTWSAPEKGSESDATARHQKGRMMKRINRIRARRGAAMVEFGLMLPVLAFALVAAVDFARVFYHDQTIINCARNGAAYASDPASPLRNTYADFKQAALADAQGLDPALTASDITSTTGTGGDGNPFVAVTVKYEFPTITSYLGFSKVDLSKTVTMRMVPVIPD
jgi:Flp pilus assembly protein TadG